MNVNLFWSYDSRMNLYQDLGYVMDLYRASMIRAKSLGYSINFYGDYNSINYFRGVVDNSYDISDIHFGVVDDLKLYIHSQNDLNCVTIDGDLILEKPLEFLEPERVHVYFDFPETKKDILREENNVYNGYGDLKRIFKMNNARDKFPSFNYDNDFACNTGLIKFNNQETKDLFLSEFKRIQEFFVSEIEPKSIKSGEKQFSLKQIRFILAQYYYGCIISDLKIPAMFLSGYNDYNHLYGNKKFENRSKFLVYKILTESGL